MTNRAKFKEIFGFEPDCGACNPYNCDSDCEWREECANTNKTPCHDWWEKEYKGPREKKSNEEAT